MQIILVQSEVEEAIKNHIGSHLTVTKGTTINIELSATRGSEGVKAIINLTSSDGATAINMKPHVGRPKGTVGASTTPATTTNPSVVTSGAVTFAKAVAPKSAPVPEPEEATSQPEATEVEDDQEPELTQEETLQADPTPELVAEAETPAAPAAAPVRSLFANLRKPQNG